MTILSIKSLQQKILMEPAPFIFIRFLHFYSQESAAQLHEDLKETSNVQLKDKLSIELEPDMRHGRVRYGSEIYFAKVIFIST